MVASLQLQYCVMLDSKIPFLCHSRMSFAASELTVIRLFIQHLIVANKKETIQVPSGGQLWGEIGKRSHVTTSKCVISYWFPGGSVNIIDIWESKANGWRAIYAVFVIDVGNCNLITYAIWIDVRKFLLFGSFIV